MLNPSRRSPPVLNPDDSEPGLTLSEASDRTRPDTNAGRREQLIRAGQTRLLYENATTGSLATILIASLLAYAHWDDIPRGVVLAWLSYVILVAAARLVLARQYWRAAPSAAESAWWNTAFVAGTALAAAGWAASAFALYPAADPASRYLLVFTLGGVMLGSGSLLAPRPEAFLTFLLPTGLLTAAHVASEGEETPLIMGLLAAVFTIVTVITTWRFHRVIQSSFELRFDNDALIARLQTAMNEAEVLNRDLEIRVRDRTAQLLEADRRKDEFLATLAHELRNPLAPIRFALEAMKVDAPSPPAAHARTVIERQVNQLVRLVDDLLDVSRITANKIQLHCAPLDLAHLMTTAVDSITPLATAAGHTLEVQLPASPVRVYADSARLLQVFANVLHNAVKFTPRGGHIWFSADPHGSNQIVVRVRDTGAGIAADVLPQVFDMFHQSQPVLDRTTGGLGIGLSLARRLVQMHQGEIAVRSAGVGCGTEVKIYLPLTDAPAGPAPVAKPPAGAATRALRVMIVEDNVDAAEMLELAVSSLGHVTALAYDGATAISTAAQFTPDVIFLDIGLPVMNGYQVAEQLRKIPTLKHAHIVAVTGWGQEDDRRRARDAGCDSHFTKPLSPATLEEVLTTFSRRVAEDTPRSGH